MNYTIRHTTKPSGPGNNIFLKENVEVKENEIILKTKISDVRLDIATKIRAYTCAEISWPAKEGIYEFDLDCPIFLPLGIICGVFLYQNDENEIDIEFGRWNKFFNKNCQIVKQGTNPIRFWNFKKNNKIVIRYEKDNVILNLNGYERMYFHNSKFERFIINLWIYGKPSQTEVKIKNFKYTK